MSQFPIEYLPDLIVVLEGKKILKIKELRMSIINKAQTFKRIS